MNFEHLPNELLIYCLKYLTIFDIFYSFDRLNNRFYQLIRYLPFQLNFQNIQKRIFDDFCTKILFNPELKQQIYSLKLSNKDTCGQIDKFLSFFSLQEFSHLQFLTLTELEEQNISKLKSMLPFLSKLISFHIIEHHEILPILPLSNLRTLSMLSLHSLQTRMDETFLITNLTIYSCSLEHLFYYLFKYFPLLKYLNVRFVSRYNYSLKTDSPIDYHSGLHLKQLIIGLFKYHFEDLERFLQQIPNLTSLTIYTKDSISMINASKWKNVIQSSLIHLDHFKFKFGCERRYNDQFILNLFQQFQTEFWCKQHSWFTEYSFERYFVFIYTIPYLSNTYQLDVHTKRFPGKNLNLFKNVTYVTLYDAMMIDQEQYYFPNIESLELLRAEQKSMDICYLKRIVNLRHLKHLNISEYGRILTSTFLLEIFKESPRLSWITMDPNDLMLLFNDKELCKYFNQVIKRLDIFKCGQPSFANSNQIKRFCEIFVNIEQLTCYISEWNDVFVLLNHLVNLSIVNIYLPAIIDRESFWILFEKKSREFNYIFRVEGVDIKSPNLFMWIGRKRTSLIY